MSNVIGGHIGTRYFQVPDSFVRSGDLRDLSGSAVKYYVFLCQQMNQTGQVELEYTNQQVCDYTGIKDHNTAKKAREELQARKRIRLRKGPSGGFIHMMLSDADEAFAPAKGRKPVRYLVRREKLSSETAKGIERQMVVPEPPESPARTTLPPRIVRFCYVHRRETDHWIREGGDPVCNECHPKPHVQKALTTVRPPTARDLGFA